MSTNRLKLERADIAAPDIIALEDFLFYVNFGEIGGKNISLYSDMSSNPNETMYWFSEADFQEYSLLGKGIMQAGDFVVYGILESSAVIPAQFTIGCGIQFFKTSLIAHEGAMIIFNGEFISSICDEGKGAYHTSSIVIYQSASIDLNGAIFDSAQLVLIELEGGRMICDEHIVTKNHRLKLNENSSFMGSLSIAAGAKLSICIDNLKGFSTLQVSGSLNLENNAIIDFEQIVSDCSQAQNIESGIIIATAASINAQLPCIKITKTLQELNFKTDSIKLSSTALDDMKLVSLYNGKSYDLILLRISKEE